MLVNFFLGKKIIDFLQSIHPINRDIDMIILKSQISPNSTVYGYISMSAKELDDVRSVTTKSLLRNFEPIQSCSMSITT